MEEDLTKLINDAIERKVPEILKTSAFTDRKVTDTPTDALQVVNKAYVDGKTVYARMYASSNQTIGSASSPYAVVSLDSVSISSGVTADTTNYRVKILTAGIYIVQAFATYSNSIANNVIEAGYTVNNGTARTSQSSAPASSQFSTSLLDVVSLSVNDYVDFRARSQGGNTTLLGNVAQTYFIVFRI